MSSALLALLLGATAVQVPNPSTPVPCDLATFKPLSQVLTPPVAIPDHDPGGVLLGPIVSIAHPGEPLSDIILEVGIQHTWVGDLRIQLNYDITCDGTPDASAVVLCRPRGTSATTPAPCGTGVGFGCSGDLSCQNTYRFHDASSTPLGVGTCTSTIASGCYGIPPDGGSPLGVFAGLPKLGCWTLLVIDATSGDIGSVCQWTVWEDKEPPIGVESVPWTRVKSLYR